MEIISEDDQSLISKVQENACGKSIEEIIRRHSPIFYEMYGKFSPLLVSSNVNTQDVLEDKNILIYKSVLSYNPDKKTKFSTWLANQTRYLCLNLLNRKMQYVQMEENDLVLQIEKNPDSRECKLPLITSNVFDVLNNLKDERIGNIFKLRYYSEKKDRTWKKIGKKLNISVQTAINLHKKGKKILKSRLKSIDNCLN